MESDEPTAGGGDDTTTSSSGDRQPGLHESEELKTRYANELLDVLLALKERFGTTDPPEEELRPFLRQRLADQGRSEDEIEELMRRL